MLNCIVSTTRSNSQDHYGSKVAWTRFVASVTLPAISVNCACCRSSCNSYRTAVQVGVRVTSPEPVIVSDVAPAVASGSGYS